MWRESPAGEYKFIRQAEEDDRMVQIVSMVRTSENKIYRQGVTILPKNWSTGFPPLRKSSSPTTA